MTSHCLNHILVRCCCAAKISAGTIPPQLSSLTALRTLCLFENELSGEYNGKTHHLGRPFEAQCIRATLDLTQLYLFAGMVVGYQFRCGHEVGLIGMGPLFTSYSTNRPRSWPPLPRTSNGIHCHKYSSRFILRTSRWPRAGGITDFPANPFRPRRLGDCYLQVVSHRS